MSALVSCTPVTIVRNEKTNLCVPKDGSQLAKDGFQHRKGRSLQFQRVLHLSSRQPRPSAFYLFAPFIFLLLISRDGSGNREGPPCYYEHEGPGYGESRGVTRRNRSNGGHCSTKCLRPYGSARHRHWVSVHSPHRYLSGCRASGGSTHGADS